MLNAPLPESGPWPLAGILDSELAQVAWDLEQGKLVPLGQLGSQGIPVSIVPIGQIAGQGPYHANFYWNQTDGAPRGPFELIQPPTSPAPT